MNKWAGIIGFKDEIEEKPGIWVETIIEKKYYGDIIRNIKNYNNQSEINNGINVTNRISIISDPYCQNNFQKIAYITFMGNKWIVSSVEVEYPRLIMTLGGNYNEEN